MNIYGLVIGKKNNNPYPIVAIANPAAVTSFLPYLATSFPPKGITKNDGIMLNNDAGPTKFAFPK